MKEGIDIDNIIEMLKSIKRDHPYTEVEVYDITLEDPGVPIDRIWYDEPTNTVNLQIKSHDAHGQDKIINVEEYKKMKESAEKWDKVQEVLQGAKLELRYSDGKTIELISEEK